MKSFKLTLYAKYTAEEYEATCTIYAVKGTCYCFLFKSFNVCDYVETYLKDDWIKEKWKSKSSKNESWYWLCRIGKSPDL